MDNTKNNLKIENEQISTKEWVLTLLPIFLLPIITSIILGIIRVFIFSNSSNSIQPIF